MDAFWGTNISCFGSFCKMCIGCFVSFTCYLCYPDCEYPGERGWANNTSVICSFSLWFAQSLNCQHLSCLSHTHQEDCITIPFSWLHLEFLYLETPLKLNTVAMWFICFVHFIFRGGPPPPFQLQREEILPPIDKFFSLCPIQLGPLCFGSPDSYAMISLTSASYSLLFRPSVIPNSPPAPRCYL